MAGRRTLGENTNETETSTTQQKPSENSSHVSLTTIIKKINEINPSDVNPLLLSEIHNGFKELFTSKKIVSEVLSYLHDKALRDGDFGEKMVLALENFLNFEVDGVVVRSELFSFIQNDFKTKDVMAECDPKLFLNSVQLLGNIYDRFRVCGAPIEILGSALLEYFDILLKGEEEELKTLAKQVFINGTKLTNLIKFELLIQSLRNTLITENLTSSAKCWLLLAIDFISNNCKPLKKVIDEFYVKQLGEEYIKLKAINQNYKHESVNSSDNCSLDSPKSENSTSSDNKNVNSSSPDDKNSSTTTPDNKNANSTTPDNKNANSTTPDNKNGSSMTPDSKIASSISPDSKNASSLSPDNKNASNTSPDNKKATSTSPDNKTPDLGLNQSNDSNKDLPQKFSDLSVKPNTEKKLETQLEVRNKVQSPTGKNYKKEPWKRKDFNYGGPEHDDRFEKGENFYGVQRPRATKPDSQNKKFNNFKSNNKGFNNFNKEIEKPKPKPQQEES